MASITKNSGPVSIAKQRNFFFDEVTKRKIDRHLSDINDTISDDDIRNVITDIRSENAGNRGLNIYSSIVPDEEAQQFPQVGI